MHTEVKYGDNSRSLMKVGIDNVANAVKATMGVRGKNVVLDTNQNILITNDGVTIARNLIIDDPIERTGAKFIKEIAEKTNDNAGDGTTTTMLLMQSIVEQGMKAIANGADGIEMRKGITKAVKNIVKAIESQKVDSSDEETLANVATISCRDSILGGMIAKIVKQAGKDGVITVEDSFETETTYRQDEGLKLTGGYLHETFVNLPSRMQTAFTDVPILVTDRTLTLGEEMGKIMEVVSNMGKKEAVVIAGSVEGDALLTAALNWQKKAIFIMPIRVLTYGDFGQGTLKDVAALTGATYLDEQEKTLLDITQADFGRASKIITDKRETTVIADDEALIKERIKYLESSKKTANEFETENIDSRIAKIRSSVFTVRIGGKTESEKEELKTRVDDAIKAAKAALINGVVSGGGSALYRGSINQRKPDITTDSGIGEKIVYEACTTPLKQMAENSGYTIDRSDLKEILDPSKAIDFSVGKVVNAYDKGIIDPLFVVTECIENAGVQAGLFLTVENSVHLIKDEQPETI